MEEPIRLVIWDLDDTLWKGTLSEGGIEKHLHENYDIVRALAGRGIMSSICSKNSFEAAKRILEEQQIWDYFIFPSIDWTPKGPRIQKIVSSVGVRPQSVLFIDDNHGNRAEATRFVPGIRAVDEGVISALDRWDTLQGKADPSLERLARYKLLERKARAAATAAGGNEEFLRASNIRVTFDHDLRANIDRAIELINRTNQLNFTKKRLSQNLDEARRELNDFASAWNRRAALVRATDNYGDYGFIGLYVITGQGPDSILEHFCFSCRTLGMGIERWVYDLLGRPSLQPVGETLPNLDEPFEIDWINQARELAEDGGAQVRLGEVRIRGGCELQPIAHYFKQHAERVYAETNSVRDRFLIRKGNTASLFEPDRVGRQTFLRAIKPLGLIDTDFQSSFLEPAEPGTVFVLTAWEDLSARHYHHKKYGFQIIQMVRDIPWTDITRVSDAEIRQHRRQSGYPKEDDLDAIRIARAIRRDFELASQTSVAPIIDRMAKLFDCFPTDCRAFVILATEFRLDHSTGRLKPRYIARNVNRRIRELAAGKANIELLSVDDFVVSVEDRLLGDEHYDRIVYRKLFEEVLRRIADEQSASVRVVGDTSAEGVDRAGEELATNPRLTSGVPSGEPAGSRSGLAAG